MDLEAHDESGETVRMFGKSDPKIGGVGAIPSPPRPKGVEKKIESLKPEKHTFLMYIFSREPVFLTVFRLYLPRTVESAHSIFSKKIAPDEGYTTQLTPDSSSPGARNGIRFKAKFLEFF